MRKFILQLIAAVLLYSAPKTAQADDNAYDAAMLAYQQHYKTGHYDAALEDAKVAYENALALFGAPDKRIADATLALAKVIKGNEAVKKLEEAKHRFETTYGKDSGSLIDPLIEIGDVLNTRQFIQAKTTYEQALNLAAKHLPPNSPTTALLEYKLGKLMLLYGDGPQAKRYLKSAQKIFKKINESQKSVCSEANLQMVNFWRAQYNHFIKGRGRDLSPGGIKVAQLDNLAKCSDLSTDNHEFLAMAYQTHHIDDAVTQQIQAIAVTRPFAKSSIYFVMPSFPMSAFKKGIEGLVVVGFTVDTKGFPHGIHVINGQNVKYFKESALKAAKQLRFIPSYQDGHPVETKDVTYTFTYKFGH